MQPQVMLVLLFLVRHEGHVVTRNSLFDFCWGGAAVGDDSLNRTLTGVRHALDGVAPGAVIIETIPRTGYRLSCQAHEAAADVATRTGFDCWRSGLPGADADEIIALEQALAGSEGGSRQWGILALLRRKAAEYSAADECTSHVRACEQAARRALQLDNHQSDALVALAGLPALFGNWSSPRRILLDVLARDPEHAPALHDLAVLEMATGRPSAAVPLIEVLMTNDPLAATFHYKRLYHLWTLGRIHAAEQVALRALELWPDHPAIWMARFWILLFTQRPDQALRLINENQPPTMPGPMAAFLRVTAEAVASPGGEAERIACEIAMKVATSGPVQAVSALIALCAIGAVDETFEVARGYYLGQGIAAPPVRWEVGSVSITDQHRRVTQPLFIPAARRLREDRRFVTLCDDIGLTAYWDEFDLVPDFLESSH
jgi:tetratricopeptide (TPR) repeat protein